MAKADFLRCAWTNAVQIDIRSYANVIGNDVVAKWCPITWEAFLDYRIESQTFSRLEMDLLRAIDAGQPENAKQRAAQYGWLVIGPDGLQHHRERGGIPGETHRDGIANPVGRLLPFRSENGTRPNGIMRELRE